MYAAMLQGKCDHYRTVYYVQFNHSCSQLWSMPNFDNLVSGFVWHVADPRQFNHSLQKNICLLEHLWANWRSLHLKFLENLINRPWSQEFTHWVENLTQLLSEHLFIITTLFNHYCNVDSFFGCPLDFTNKCNQFVCHCTQIIMPFLNQLCPPNLEGLFWKILFPWMRALWVNFYKFQLKNDYVCWKN